MWQSIIIISIVVLVSNCHDEEWHCVEKEKTMFSMNDNGDIEAANKGCTCHEMQMFNLKTFGKVEEISLAIDHSC